METPSRCCDCKIHQYYQPYAGAPVDYWCAYTNKDIDKPYDDVRPDWCPLKELPEEKEVNGHGMFFAMGWNSFRDEILED